MLREVKLGNMHYFVDDRDLKQGVCTWYYENGKIEEQSFYINDQLQGECKVWYNDSQLKVHCFYVNSVRHGERKEWFSNGQIRSHTFYVKGNIHGEFKRWDTSGILAKHCFYVNDILVSFSKIPYPKTSEDLLYFKLKYGLQLLPVETTC